MGEEVEIVPYKYSYKFPQRTLGTLKVCNTGVQRCESGYSWGPGVRDHFLIHYVISGRGFYQKGDQTYSLKTGDLFLACPDENIFYRADDSEPWEYCWVGFYGADARAMLEQTDLSAESPVVHVNGDDVYKEMMQIYNSRGSQPHQTVFMTGTLYRLLSILIRERHALVARKTTDSVQRACEYIADNYAMPISITDIAEHVGLSRSRLYRLFMSELRLSPVQVLTQYRIRQACELLRRGDLSVKTVAASVGYENQLYFSRRFREIMGVPPTQYIPSPEEVF